MAVARRLLTYEDLLDIPDDDRRYEIIEGALYVSPTPAVRHQDLRTVLLLLIGNWVVPRGLGKVFGAPVDVELARHTIVEPDIVFIRRERRGIITEQRIMGAPDLVVEILSPSTRNVDLGSKLERYATAGVPEYWIADPENETFRILVLRNGRCEPQAEDEGNVRSIVLPGLVIEIAALFRGLVP